MYNVYAYLLEEEYSCQISSRSNLKRRPLRLFEEVAPTSHEEQQEQD